jgi:quinol monooxygenase YgiN
MIIECIRIEVRPEICEDVRRGLTSLIGPTQVRPGCIDCRLYQNSANASEFHLESQWRTMNDFLQHACSDLYRYLLELIETSIIAPIIEFHDVSQTHGLELVRAAREQHAALSPRLRSILRKPTSG